MEKPQTGRLRELLGALGAQGTSRDLDSEMSAKIACKILFLLSVTVLSGCASEPSPPPAFVHPEPLYAQDQPYARLYVEIDRMQGASFPDYLAEELKAFLGKYCLKPDGIEVALDPPMPAGEFEGVGLSAASILCTDGPVTDRQAQPAYLHVFVYDGSTTFKGAMRPCRAVSTGPWGIFWNVDYARSFSRPMKVDMLRHELGHVLGLCQNTPHGDGAHCRKYGCLMHWMPDWASQVGGMTHVFFREHALCEDCERDLALARQAPPDDALSFVGPFLIRRMDGYSVASLLADDIIIAAPTPDGFDWRKALHQSKAGIRRIVQDALAKSRDWRPSHRATWGGLYDRRAGETRPEVLEQDIAILRKAVDDPSPSVRGTASAMLRIREDAPVARGR